MFLQASRLVRLAVALASAFSVSASLYLLTQPSVMAIVCQPAGFDCEPEALRATAWQVWVSLSCEYLLACLVCVACMILVSQLMPLRRVQQSPSNTGSQLSAANTAKSDPSPALIMPSASTKCSMQLPSHDEQPTETCTSCSMVGTAGQSSSTVASEQLQRHGEAAGQTGADPTHPPVRGRSSTHEPLSSLPQPQSDHQIVSPAAVSPAPSPPTPAATPAPAPLMTINIAQLLQEAAAARANGAVASPLYHSPNHSAAFLSSKVCVVSLLMQCDVAVLTLMGLQ